MPPLPYPAFELARLSGGQNSFDPPRTLRQDELTIARNVDWYGTPIARRRLGCAADALTSYGGTSRVQAMALHMPQGTLSTAEFFAFDASSDTTAWRKSASSAWSATTLADAMTTGAQLTVSFRSFNGKLYAAYNSAVDRLQCFDGSAWRRVGLATPAAPTAANTGAGAYAATLRYYRVAWVTIVSGSVVRRSELSSALSFTPSGAGTAARVTRPTLASESETHWELYAADAGDEALGFSYKIATVATGTSTYDDSAVPSTYETTNSGLNPLIGENTVPISPRFLAVDGDRLLLAGSNENRAVYGSTVFFTPFGGDLDVGDDERIPNTVDRKFHLTVDRGVGGDITGMMELDRYVYVFKSDRCYRLVRTQLQATDPYRAVLLSPTVGCIAARTLVQAPDDHGNPCLYFLSRRGPYRLVPGAGFQFLGRDILDVWESLDISNGLEHGIYVPGLNQVWFYVSTIDSYPNTRLVFDIDQGRLVEGQDVRRGWAIHDGYAGEADCSLVAPSSFGFPNTIDLVPWIGGLQADGTGPKIWRCNTGTTDASLGYRAYLRTRPLHIPDSPDQTFSVTYVEVDAEVAEQAALEVRTIRDYGREEHRQSLSLGAKEGETRAAFLYQDEVKMAGCTTVQLELGDPDDFGNGTTWKLDAVRVGYDATQERV